MKSANIIHTMRTLYVFTAALLLGYTCNLVHAQMALEPQESLLSEEEITWIEQTITSHVEEYNIPSLVVGIIKEGKVARYFSTGTRDRKSTQRVNEHTIFQLASLTKSFTAILANYMINEGKLDLEESIITYLPQSLPTATLEKLRPITVEHVLQHRAGLPRGAQNEPKTPFGLPLKASDYSEADLLENLNLLELQYEPDTKWDYSNFGYSLMGYLLERVSGLSYEALIQQYIAEKLNMPHTTISLTATQQKHLATPYRPDMRNMKTRPWEFGKLVAAGGIFSSVSDLSQLMIKQMEAYENYEQAGSLSPFILTHHKKPMGKSGYPYYGFGCFENQSSIDTSLIHYGHSGDVDGYASQFSFVPSKKTGIIMLTSCGGTWFWTLDRLLQKKILGLPIRQEIELSPQQLKKYVGKYKFEPDLVLTMTRKGNQLYTQTPGFPKHKLFAEAENKFFYKAFEAQFEFDLNNQGEIVNIKYTQNGKSVYPQKIK